MTADSNRVAIITGGTGALGQAVTLRLLADGASVALPWIVKDEEARLRGRVPADARARVLTAEADVIDDAGMGRFVQTVVERFGHVDVLVSLVGGFAGGALVDTDRATWDRMIAMNLTSAFTASRATLPRMLEAGYGRIVLTASRAVLPPSAGFIAYTVSKAAVTAFTQALAAETRGRGITVNAIAPSTMDTPANRAAMPDADRTGWVSVESVAELVSFLAGESAGGVTGAVVPI
jgi:NAD(P)-dependent dehydrogenase (short-subunit alcohol dehydrogenase family)